MERLYSSTSSPTTTSTKQSEIFIDLTYIAIADPALSTTPPGQCMSTSVLPSVKLQHCKHSIGVAGQRACMGVQACSVRSSKETSYRANGKTYEANLICSWPWACQVPTQSIWQLPALLFLNARFEIRKKLLIVQTGRRLSHFIGQSATMGLLREAASGCKVLWQQQRREWS